MLRRPPRSTRTDTLFPYTTLFRSHRQSFLACCQSEPQRYVRLSGALWPQSDGVLTPLDPLAARHLEHLHLVEPGDGGEVEAVEAFDGGEARGLDAPLDHATLPVDHFPLDEAVEESGRASCRGRVGR